MRSLIALAIAVIFGLFLLATFANQSSAGRGRKASLEP